MQLSLYYHQNKYPDLDIQFIGGNAMEQYIIGVTFAATGR